MTKVKLYTSHFCGDCVAAKYFLTKRGIEFEEIDITNNRDAVETIIAARGKRVTPTLEFNGNFIDGHRFDPDKFEKDLAKLLG
ncbi:MAG: glutaredoxin family protein [Nitrospinota bacterium]